VSKDSESVEKPLTDNDHRRHKRQGLAKVPGRKELPVLQAHDPDSLHSLRIGPIMGMTRKQFTVAHKAFCEELIAITAKKNHDYTGASPDPFANFKNVQALGICTVEQGFMARITDKISRLAGFLKNGEFKVKGESFIDTAQDLSNYVALLAVYHMSKTTVLIADPKEKSRLPDIDMDPKPSPDIMVAVPKKFLADVHGTVTKTIGFLNEIKDKIGMRPTSTILETDINKEKDFLSHIAIMASEYKNNGKEV